MAPKPIPASTTNSGIRQTSNGDSVIPSSTRADGTVRKEIRIKPGYKPPEDVEVYKNRTAETWKNRGKGGVPGAETVTTGENDSQNTAAANKNAKRREARKRAAAAASAQDEKSVVEASNGQVEANADLAKSNGDSVAPQDPVDPDVEKAKEARKLAKKLRQARELQEKKDKGDELLPDQFAKVIKINELIRQLDSLGFDPEGQRKGQEADGEGEAG